MSCISIGPAEKSISSSTVSGSEPSGNYASMLVQQLKANVFEEDLFKTINESSSIESDIRDLLKQLSDQDLPNPIVDFVLEFESFLNQISHKMKMKHESVKKIKQINVTVSKKWELIA